MALDYKSSLSRYRRYLQLVGTRPLWTASLWVILSLILLIVLLLLALKPTLVTISGLMGQIRQQEEVSQQLDTKIKQVQTAIGEMDSIQDKILLLDVALPTDPMWDELAATIAAIATNSGITVTNITIGKVPLVVGEPAAINNQGVKSQLPGEVIPIRFSLTATGEYTQMRQVVTDLESMKRVIMLNSVSIDADKGGVLNLRVDGEVGYIPDKFL